MSQETREKVSHSLYTDKISFSVKKDKKSRKKPPAMNARFFPTKHYEENQEWQSSSSDISLNSCHLTGGSKEDNQKDDQKERTYNNEHD